MAVGSLVMVHAPDWPEPKLGIVTAERDNDWHDVFVFKDLPSSYTCGDCELMSNYWCEPLS